jgi:hypothetical protein
MRVLRQQANGEDEVLWLAIADPLFQTVQLLTFLAVQANHP